MFPCYLTLQTLKIKSFYGINFENTFYILNHTKCLSVISINFILNQINNGVQLWASCFFVGQDVNTKIFWLGYSSTLINVDIFPLSGLCAND